jgi:hypothetical protein
MIVFAPSGRLRLLGGKIKDDMYGVSGIMNSIGFSFCHDFNRMAHGFRHDIATMYNGPTAVMLYYIVTIEPR